MIYTPLNNIRMGPRIALIIASSILMAGCVDASTTSNSTRSDTNQPNGPYLLDGIDSIGTPDPLPENANWTRLEFNIAGEPGTWVVIYRPFSETYEHVQFNTSVTLEAKSIDDEPLGVFLVRPMVVSGNRMSITEAQLLVEESGGHIQFQESWRTERVIMGSSFKGVFAVVGSTHAWNASVSLDLGGDGNLTGPSHVAVGKGASLSYPGDRIAGTPTSPVGSIHLSKQVESPGWSHVEILWDQILEDTVGAGIRACTLRFEPDGDQDCRNSYVATGEINPTSFFDPQVPIAYGQFPVGPSIVEIEVHHAQTSDGLELAIIHLPFNDNMFPEDIDMQGAYIIHKKAMA